MPTLVEYHLSRPCGGKRFIRSCSNSFSITTCGATQCASELPSTICLVSSKDYPPLPCNPCQGKTAPNKYLAVVKDPGGSVVFEVVLDFVYGEGNPNGCKWEKEYIPPGSSPPFVIRDQFVLQISPFPEFPHSFSWSQGVSSTLKYRFYSNKVIKDSPGCFQTFEFGSDISMNIGGITVNYPVVPQNDGYTVVCYPILDSE